MENKRLFQKYYSRLAKEGMIKALICGFIIGFGLGLISAFAAFMVNNFNLSKLSGLWISLGIGLAAALAAAPIFYYKLFRPVTSKIAERVDRLGLDERLITMMELEKDESYIAMRQREDAKEKLSSVSSKRLKFSIFVAPIVALAVVAACSVTMITVSAQKFEEKKAWTAIGPRPVDGQPVDGEYIYYTVQYISMGGGYIDGDMFQIVVAGEDATTVTAKPYDGYGFKDWLVDGSTNPVRTDSAIMEDYMNFAQFQPTGDEGGEEDNSDEQEEKPMTGGEEEGEFDPNVILDGGIYYLDEDVFPDYLADAMRRLESGEDIPDILRLLIELYYGTIKI